MRIFTFIVLLSLSNMLFAQCSKEPISATYRITQTSPASASENPHSLVLWRNHGLAALEYRDAGITELWHKTSHGKLQLIRYFDEYQRGIEYQPGEISGRHSSDLWHQKYQLVPETTIQTLTLTKSEGKDCQQRQTYTSTNAGKTAELIWLPASQLPAHYETKNAGKSVIWELVEIKTTPTEVEQRFAELSDYQTTDYADIGDNESDPFLLKMINLGFVEHGSKGFYDSAGNSLDGDHHHH